MVAFRGWGALNAPAVTFTFVRTTFIHRSSEDGWAKNDDDEKPRVVGAIKPTLYFSFIVLDGMTEVGG